MKDVLEIVWEETKVTMNSSGVPNWKRGLDVGCVLFLLPALLPLGLLISLWIKIVAPGPLLFRQKRVGYRGNQFVCCCYQYERSDNRAEPAAPAGRRGMKAFWVQRLSSPAGC